MKNNSIAGYTNEELIRNEKKIKGICIILSIMIILLLLINIYLTFKRGFNALNVIPIALLPVLIINMNNWNQLKKEKKNRFL